MPKAYEVIENGTAIKRFVLMLDRTDGRFERYKIAIGSTSETTGSTNG